MIPTFIILFREILEIAIILSVVLAATRGVAGRNRWVAFGIAGGVAGSALVAIFANQISNAMEGMGQEVFNAGVLFAAVAMISWTVVWMQKHGKELAQKIKQVGKRVSEGELPLYSLAILVSLTMWREGAEIVLFMTGILRTTEESMLAIIAGGAAGGACAATLGLLLYLGLIKISTRYVFSVTSFLLTLVACGMSAQAAGYLVAADMLPALITPLWDSSHILSESSIVGKILHALLGYSERPSGIQLVFYIITLLAIFALIKWVKFSGNRKILPLPHTGTITAIALAAVALTLFSAQPAEAGFKVYSPSVEKHMVEIETKNQFNFDDDNSKNGSRQHVIDLGYGVNDWLAVEIEGEWEKEPRHGYSYTATEIEGTVVFTEQGEYWLDAGLRAGYEFSHEERHADAIEAKLLLEKNAYQFKNTVNLGLERQVGNHRDESTEFNWSARSLYLHSPLLNPGLEYFADYGEIKNTGNYSDQKHRLGPVMVGSLGHGIKYELGLLFGISKPSEDQSLKLNLEYEFPI